MQGRDFLTHTEAVNAISKLLGQKKKCLVSGYISNIWKVGKHFFFLFFSVWKKYRLKHGIGADFIFSC